jgi:uncharacterized protein
MSGFEPFLDTAANGVAVRGFLHRAVAANGDGIVLTHGAGANCASPLLITLANAFCESGITVLRCDLPFRQRRPKGPPQPGSAKDDQEGLRRSVGSMKKIVGGRVFLGGHSYGGRQGTMLAAAEPGLTDGLLLLSYPLHPPQKPTQLRTTHFPDLRTAALFVHGDRDSFGSIEEMRAALEFIPARTRLFVVEHAGHELLSAKTKGLAESVKDSFADFFAPE